ncbi:hypothetical protein NDU88_004473 [Pleurodeles waltl]|uniref:Uncharacterized protein n=1 Tax=Pleurodeles waltl TaxID=8319 RepID=A0AAV7VIV1_PLEWA|nr:hypothetical protein NDU88_004473 [Pleurodeles waltl]
MPQREGKSLLANPEKTQDPLRMGWECIDRRRRDEENNQSLTQELRGLGSLSLRISHAKFLEERGCTRDIRYGSDSGRRCHALQQRQIRLKGRNEKNTG